MSGSWKRTTLADVVDIISGGTPKTTVPEYWNGEIPWLSVSDFNTGYRWVSSAEKSITAIGVSESATTVLDRGDIVISARGTVGVVAQLGRPMAFNQSCYGIRGKRDVADTDFIYYLLRYIVPKLKQVVHGAVFDTITRDTFEIVQIDLPSLPEQRAIARILGTLDDKIELNRQMNETLDAMARALFKSWFVDFDPVHAKAEGRDPGLPVDIAALFPDSFEDSELGEIPKGWTVRKLGELLELAYGRALKESDRRSGTVAVYGSNGQIGWHDEKLEAGPGIVVGRKGNPGIVTWAPSAFFAIDTTFYVVSKPSCPSLYFLFFALQNIDLPSMGADSAVPGLNRNLAYLSAVLLPPLAVLKRFNQSVDVLFDRMNQIQCESRTLAALRDTMLPGLLSGELRADVAGQLVEVNL
jgi:type I restriction enzyme S subunit